MMALSRMTQTLSRGKCELARFLESLQLLVKVDYTRSTKRNGTKFRNKGDKQMNFTSIQGGKKIGLGEQRSDKKLTTIQIIQIVNMFAKSPNVTDLATKSGITGKMFTQAVSGFRASACRSDKWSAELHVTLSDIIHRNRKVENIYPYFEKYAFETYPQLTCLLDLKKISDLTTPIYGYPEAREMRRKIIFHAGPTNSGKTYQALKQFMEAESGIYCSPLKMLANEICVKTNAKGIPCDLVTGEEKRLADPTGNRSKHVACTIEMTQTVVPYEVAIIDEIQMLGDLQRGWAWTRALLGVCAEEVHVCGETSVISLVRDLLEETVDEIEVKYYDRLASLTCEDKAVGSISAIEPGDCIVCFSRKDVFSISKLIENTGKECAVIYGNLPPGTKMKQAEKFNDPNSSCKILVSTDAIGMGLNLAIKRIVFYSLEKVTRNIEGEKSKEVLTTSHAKQIAGRAGRYKHYDEGLVTTFYPKDLPTLHYILSENIEPHEVAGLQPTMEQIVNFSKLLPDMPLSKLVDTFMSVCVLDHSQYFMCNMKNFVGLADSIEHINLEMSVRYTFCCAPINYEEEFECRGFVNFASQYARGVPVRISTIKSFIGWECPEPLAMEDLLILESKFNVLELYLWLGYKFPDLFPDIDEVRKLQSELDYLSQCGIDNIIVAKSNKKKTKKSLKENKT